MPKIRLGYILPKLACFRNQHFPSLTHPRPSATSQHKVMQCPSQTQHNKLMNIADRLNRCLDDDKFISLMTNKDFNIILQSQCNAEVFPLTKAEAMVLDLSNGNAWNSIEKVIRIHPHHFYTPSTSCESRIGFGILTPRAKICN